MKLTTAKLITIYSLFLCFPRIVNGASTPAGIPDKAITDVIEMEATLAKACVAGNAEAYAVALADDFIGINSDGTSEAKKPYIDELRSGTFECSRYEARSVSCQKVGEGIVYHAIISQTATWNGTDCSGQYRLTSVWVIRSGQWVCICNQWTTIQKP